MKGCLFFFNVLKISNLFRQRRKKNAVVYKKVKHYSTFTVFWRHISLTYDSILEITACSNVFPVGTLSQIGSVLNKKLSKEETEVYGEQTRVFKH